MHVSSSLDIHAAFMTCFAHKTVMALRRVATVVLLLCVASAVPAWSQQSGGTPREACLSSAESRDLFVTDKLVQPFSVMRDAAQSVQAEAIDIQLCRVESILVYDVTLLNQAGQVFHRLINAATGAPLPSPPQSTDPGPPPRPMPRPGGGPDIYVVPGPPPGGGGYLGPRFGPRIFPGPRPGRLFYPAPRGGHRPSLPARQP